MASQNSQSSSSLNENDIRNTSASSSLDSVLFKHDRLYGHGIVRINYTTYDVRRSQDIVKAWPAQCNVMVLADRDESQSSGSHHPFNYARVLGIFHVNVVIVGPGMVNYQPQRMDFLWVRWYREVETIQAGWDTQKLDCIQFPPVGDEDAFGFIDPVDVLRGCHIIPAFSKGGRYLDGRGLSRLGRDASDWTAYYVNR
jgi:hypothetical protein